MVDYRRLAPDFKRTCRAFEKVEARYWRADRAYSKAADGNNLETLAKAFEKFRIVEHELLEAYNAMSKASAADTVAHFIFIQRVIVAHRKAKGRK